MYRPGFGVVTSVVTVLCVVGFVTNLLRPQIPPLAPNAMARETAEFMRQGQFQSVDWKPFTTATMAEARRAGHPILLLIGTPSSHIGHILDEDAFTGREIASYLHRNYTCIRVDGAAEPEWLNALLPFGRLRIGFQPDLQIWALDPTGAPFDFVGRAMADQWFDRNAMLPVLIALRKRYEQLDNNGRVQGIEIQPNDASLIDRLSGAAVPFAVYGEHLREGVNPEEGGFSSQGLAGIAPLAWRYFLLTGDTKTLDLSLSSALHTPLVDLLDGGFFHTLATSGNGRWLEYEKLPVENSEAMLTLAQIDSLSPSPERRRLAEATWDYLATWARDDSSFFAGQVGQEGPRHRSKRYSFPSARLRSALPPDDRQWAAKNLGLDPARHPQVVPFLETSATAGSPLDRILKGLRAATGAPPARVEAGLADIGLTCAARAIQTARIWGESGRVEQSVSWLESLEPLRAGGDILSRLDDPMPHPGYLGDYLAYSDARLQDYLATGRVRSLELGLAILRRARSLFAGSSPGVFVLNHPSRPAPIANASVPELADNLHESCTARSIRLMLAYGRLLGDTPEGNELRSDAHAAVALFGQIADVGGKATAGYFCAAADATDEAHAIAVGPQAQALADALLRRVPTRLVAAAFGPVRKDLQTRHPGIYIVRGAPQGPYTVEEAAAKLSPTLDLGLGP